MPDYRIIALDLDGTLLNSNKELTERSRAVLEKAAAEGIEIVPTTGRFYDGMPEAIRQLPFIRYFIAMNGAEVRDLQTGELIYAAEMPWQQCVEIMTEFDSLPFIYDCYMNSAGWMSGEFMDRVDSVIDSPHFRALVHRTRNRVPELKAFLRNRGQDVQKISCFTRDEPLRLEMLSTLAQRYENIIVSSSVDQNIEINHINANKGAALQALAKHLSIPLSSTMSFGDGLNDLSMLRDAGLGIAMANACPEAKACAKALAASCDEDGVAKAIEKYCFNIN